MEKAIINEIIGTLDKLGCVIEINQIESKGFPSNYSEEIHLNISVSKTGNEVLKNIITIFDDSSYEVLNLSREKQYNSQTLKVIIMFKDIFKHQL